MFSFHKPKVYRSPSGCCICGAKSSSSRFTSSKRYESEFSGCFRTGTERRTGDICNACVLLVKRWRKLPKGTDRHWQHMLDARSAGTNRLAYHKGGRSASRKDVSGKRDLVFGRYANSPAQNNGYDSSDDSDLSDCEGFNRRQRQKRTRQPQSAAQFSSFLDPSYWKKTKVCCGTIFVGAAGEVMIDARFWHPCASCRPGGVALETGSTAGQDVMSDDGMEDVSDSASVDSSSHECIGASVFNDATCPRRKSVSGAVYELEL